MIVDIVLAFFIGALLGMVLVSLVAMSRESQRHKKPKLDERGLHPLDGVTQR